MSTGRRSLYFDQLIEGTREAQLLGVPLSELRAYVALCQMKTQELAARVLDSDTRTISRQRAAIQKRITRLTGEGAFITSPHRGGELRLTESGRLLYEHAEEILRHVYILNQKFKTPRPVRLAFTNYMTEVPAIGRILHEARGTLGVGLAFKHVASDEITSVLKDQLVDFVFAGRLVINGVHRHIDKAITFRPLLSRRFGLVANYRITAKGDAASLLRQEKEFLLPPTHGSFLEILQTFLTPTEIKNLPGLRSDNIRFSLDLLRFNLQPRACVIVDEEIYRSLPARLPFIRFEDGPIVQIGVYQLKERAVSSGHGGRERRMNHPIETFERLLSKHFGKTDVEP